MNVKVQDNGWFAAIALL